MINVLLFSGPWGLPILGRLLELKRTSPHAWYVKMSEQYGEIFSVKLGSHLIVCVGSAKLVKDLFSRSDSTNRPQTPLNKLLGGLGKLRNTSFIICIIQLNSFICTKYGNIWLGIIINVGIKQVNIDFIQKNEDYYIYIVGHVKSDHYFFITTRTTIANTLPNREWLRSVFDVCNNIVANNVLSNSTNR